MFVHHNILFQLHRRTADAPPHLQARITWDGSRSAVYLNLGFVIDEERWDARARRPKPRSFHGSNRIPAAVIDTEMDRYRDAAAAVFARLDRWPSVEAVRSALRLELGLDEAPLQSTADCFDKFFRESSVTGSWKEGTVKKMRTVGQHLKGFEPLATMDGFTEANLTRYVAHLRDDIPMRDVTIHREIGYVRWFLHWADDRKLLGDDGWKRFKPVLRESVRPVVFLTWSELMSVWDWKPGDRMEADVRDMFCFSAFTSLRWSDVQDLRWSAVTDRDVRVVTVKTSDPLVIELNRWSLEILGRMVDRGFDDDRVFPRTHNQVANRILKRIGEECGIDTPVRFTVWHGSEREDIEMPKYKALTFHAGRRTFICNALTMGIPPTTVMQWTGHSDYQAMKPYIAVADSARAEAMSLFDRLQR